jgi:hypothetical protein
MPNNKMISEPRAMGDFMYVENENLKLSGSLFSAISFRSDDTADL